MITEDKFKKQENEKKFAYWMHQLRGLGNRRKIAIQRQCQTAKDFFELSEQQMRILVHTIEKEDGEYELRPLLKDCEIEEIQKNKEEKVIQAKWDAMKEAGIKFVFYGEEEYPRHLLEIPDPPYGLTYYGSLPQKEEKTIALIGARNCSNYGVAMAKEFARTLSKQGISIVSGMAMGIDGIAQREALLQGGKTYAVLGCGVDVCYPLQNNDIYEKLKKEGGIISEYPLHTQARAQLFPPRNRIISGLSDAVLVIEAREKSGTLITVDMALEQGRDVYALPGRVGDSLSGGCNRLLKQGALMVCSPEELIEEITGYQSQPNKINKSGEKRIDYQNSGEEIVLSILMEKPSLIEEIAEEFMKKSQESLGVIMKHLTSLELRGVIGRMAGGYYYCKN